MLLTLLCGVFFFILWGDNMVVISIHKFLLRFYGISISLNELVSHKDIKHRFKFLKRCSFEYADNNPEIMNSGKIIYVMDSYGEYIPYIAPEMIMGIENCVTDIYIEKEEDEELIIDEILELPTYLLRECLAKYKFKPSFYRVIKKELTNRGVYENKKHRIEKEIRELEESDFDDKYQRRRKIKYNQS